MPFPIWITFDDLDKQLREAGNDRRAKVNSDIALYIPTLQSPLLFHGETNGNIADTVPSFQSSVQYPWLTPETFNGWIIPDGSVPAHRGCAAWRRPGIGMPGRGHALRDRAFNAPRNDVVGDHKGRRFWGR
jgi:hypothetical protein